MLLSTVSFQRGELIPENAHKVKCGLYAHKKTGKHTVAVAMDDGNVFSGNEPAADSQMAWNLIAVRNKKTNKVRLICEQPWHTLDDRVMITVEIVDFCYFSTNTLCTS
jgi:hypothetical protein